MDVEATHLFGVLIVLGMALMPFYNAFIERMKIKKAQDDQFHARINDNMKDNSETNERVSRLEGYNEGRRDAFAEMAAAKGLDE